MTPFMGQGFPPPGGATVYVSIGLDRLIDIDDENYRFECVFFMLLTWSDPRAKPAMLEATEKSKLPGGNCSFPCTSLYTYDEYSECCDDIWLPHLEFMNARGFSQDRVVRYGIEFGNDLNSSAVGWWAHIAGEYYTNLDFRAFPFDSQNLVVQVAYADRTPEIPVTFTQGSTALTLYMPKAGDDISGWTVKEITMSFYNVSDEAIYKRFIDFSKAGDPLPIHPSDRYAVDFFRPSLWSEGFVIFIQIDRIYIYFILTAIVPIALNVWLALLVFSVSPKHLDTRLGIIVTLFLSLTALMLVVGGVLPQSSEIVPTQQLVLLSYIILGLVGLESIIIYKIVTVERQKNIKKRTLVAKEAFTKRWNTVSQNFRRENTALREARRTGLGIDSDLGMRRRRTNNSTAESELPADIAVDLPDEMRVEEQQQQLGASPSDQAADNNEASNHVAAAAGKAGDSEGRNHHTKPEGISNARAHHSHQNLPFGGVNPDDSDDSDPFGGASAGSDFESSDEDQASRFPKGGNTPIRRGTIVSPQPTGRMSEIKAWFVLMGHKLKMTYREIKKNPDYALYWALSADRVFFWTTLIAYNTALIVIFAINATYQAPIRY